MISLKSSYWTNPSYNQWQLVVMIEGELTVLAHLTKVYRSGCFLWRGGTAPGFAEHLVPTRSLHAIMREAEACICERAYQEDIRR